MYHESSHFCTCSITRMETCELKKENAWITIIFANCSAWKIQAVENDDVCQAFLLPEPKRFQAINAVHWSQNSQIDILQLFVEQSNFPIIMLKYIFNIENYQ